MDEIKKVKLLFLLILVILLILICVVVWNRKKMDFAVFFCILMFLILCFIACIVTLLCFSAIFIVHD